MYRLNDIDTFPRVTLTAGARLGPYEVVAPIGKGGMGRTYDISADVERFLMVKESASANGPEFVVALDWFEELKRLAPAEN